MNINYAVRKNNYSTIGSFNSSECNILILGKANTQKERREIINPRGLNNAEKLYGLDSELYLAYKQCQSITNNYNVYTANCLTYSDFMNVMSLVLHYNFSYIVPIGLKMEDTFFNENSNKYEYFIDYFMYLIEECQSLSTIIMTSDHAKDHDTMDKFINHYNTVLNDYYKHTAKDNDNYNLYKKNGSDIIFLLNNLVNCQYANVILAAQLATENYSIYPKDAKFETYYDIYNTDVKNKSYAYHKYNYLTKEVSIENLVNMRLYEDIYKNALIDNMIKSVFRILDFDEYKGKLYNAYIKLQVERKANTILNKLKGTYFKNYEIKNVGFVKTNETSGYIYIELLIMPYGFMEYIDVVMEV